MKRLKVDVEDIAICMERQGQGERCAYLDMETGETILIPDEVMSALEDEEYRQDLPAWEAELLPMAKEISEGSSRYVEIPARFSDEAYEVMGDFAAGVKNANIRREIENALDGKGAFRRFKNVLRERPELEKEWFKFKASRDKEKVKEWLKSVGIETEEEK